MSRPKEAWQFKAACIGKSELFHSYYGEHSRTSHRRVQEAKAICRTCTVQEQCLKLAMDTFDSFGIFGGTTEGERRQLRKDAQGDVQRDELARKEDAHHDGRDEV